MTLREHALTIGRQAAQEITWRHGSNTSPDNPDAAMHSQCLALRIRPAGRKVPRDTEGHLPECWLIAEWPPQAAEPVQYWLSNRDPNTPLKKLARLGKIRWRVEHDYRELKHALGMDHFEGRPYTGWHRHVTLVVLAQAFATLLRLDPQAPTPA